LAVQSVSQVQTIPQTNAVASIKEFPEHLRQSRSIGEETEGDDCQKQSLDIITVKLLSCRDLDLSRVVGLSSLKNEI
jgi:hypothetical protein